MKSKFKKGIFIVLILGYCLHPASYSAQIVSAYMDIGTTYNTFTNSDLFEVQKPRFSHNLKFGMAVAVNASQKLKIKPEVGWSVRSFENKYPGFEFQYRFLGGNFNLGLEYDVHKRICLEAGVGVFLYQSMFRENDDFERIGHGFRNKDIVLFSGLHYQIYKGLYLGTRFNYGLIPMVRFKAIGDFGEDLGWKEELNFSAFELFLRIKISRSTE